MNIIRTKKDKIINSINFGGNKTETVQHVLQMQKVSLFPEYIKSSSFCNSSFFHLHFGLRLPFCVWSLHLKISAPKEVGTQKKFAPKDVCT